VKTRISIILAACGLAGVVLAGSPPAKPGAEWPLSAPVAHAPPAVRHTGQVRNPLDAFLLARLEPRGLTLAPEASRRVLVRRLYFDLIGLPPTPGETEAFVSDTDPGADERLVDRLLDDPRHGERWARFWLDLARYADTAGYEGDPDLPHAWRYRDYVIDSFNRDKPYDQFIHGVQIGAHSWDDHGNIEGGMRKHSSEVDRPVAALLQDLKQRGLLEETLVVWASEMGRTPFINGGAPGRTPGREHNSYGLCMWMAGGGVRGGATAGETDEFGLRSIGEPILVRDVHATLLHLMGLHDESLTYLHAGRIRKLTDIGGRVLPELIA